MKIVIFSCGYNCSKYVKNHIESVKNQTYKNYTHILVDDCSDDHTLDIICQNRDNNMFIHRTGKNQKWIQNAIDYLSVSNDDIVIVLDMDDWFANIHVLEDIIKVYTETDCWMTYSKFYYTSKKATSDWIPPYSKQTLEDASFRKCIWSFTHLRTFKGFLWNKINKEDLKDKNGEYFKYAYDQAIFFPMLEMSAPDKIQRIDKVQYIYNDENPLNVHKTEAKKQIESASYIKKMKKYDSLINNNEGNLICY